MSLRLISYNIRLGGAGREKPIAEVVKACDPDLVILQEATRPDVVERVASDCGMKHWGALRGHSLGYISRIKVAHHAWHKIVLAKRRYLEIVLEGSSIRIFGVHLSAVHSNITERRRSYELSSLLKDIKRHQKGFHVVTGDFNTLAPGEHLDMNRLPVRFRAMLWITGRNIRWTTIRLMLDGGYTDGYRALHKDDDGFTFPTWDPHVRLDYAFVPADFASRLTRCEIVRDVSFLKEASDHFPLLSEVSEQR